MSILTCGDSFTADDPNIKTWNYIIGERLGVPIINRAASGSGYVQHGLGYPSRFVRQALFQPPTGVKLLIFFGSVNDRWATHMNETRLWAFLAHREAARAYPGVPQLIVGPQWAGPDDVPTGVLDARTAVSDAMWAYDWKNPMIDPIAENWFPKGDLAVLQADKFHPTAQGQVRIADKLEQRIRAAILP